MPAEVAVERFVEFSSAEPPFHLFMDASFEGVVLGEPGNARIEMDGDVLGNDFDGSLVMRAPGVTIEADVIAVDGVSYLRPVGGSWEESGDFDQTQPLNPVAGLEAEDVTYQGVITRAGRALHRLSVDKWTGASPRRLGIRRARIHLSVFEVLVDNEGEPVEVELQFSINGRLLGEPLSFSYDVYYEFSNVGQPLNIEPPI